MSELWADRVLALVKDPDLSPSHLRSQFASARTALALAQERVDAIERILVAWSERTSTELDRLLEWRADPVVLVRPYGAPSIFHSGDQPCGKADAASFERLLLGEAVERDLSPCRSCGFLVPGAADAVGISSGEAL